MILKQTMNLTLLRSWKRSHSLDETQSGLGVSHPGPGHHDQRPVRRYSPDDEASVADVLEESVELELELEAAAVDAAAEDESGVAVVLAAAGEVVVVAAEVTAAAVVDAAAAGVVVASSVEAAAVDAAGVLAASLITPESRS